MEFQLQVWVVGHLIGVVYEPAQPYVAVLSVKHTFCNERKGTVLNREYYIN